MSTHRATQPTAQPPGLARASARLIRHTCPCGFPIVRYPGRYPKHCPRCDRPVPNAAAMTPDPAAAAAPAE